MSDNETSTFDEIRHDKREALSLVTEAFAEAELQGLDFDCVVQATLFAIFREMVDVYGEEPTAVYAESLPAKIRDGGFTVTPRH